MTTSVSDYAKMSKGAYHERPVEGYDIDTSLSTGDWTVYKNKTTNAATIAFRGTTDNPLHSSFYRDAGADIAAFFGAQKLNSRYKRADRLTQQVIDKYGKENVTVTGHSLGGQLAAYVSNKYKVDASTFNALVTPKDVFDNRAGKTDWSHVTQYINKGDIVSESGRMIKGGKKVIDYKPAQEVISTYGKGVAKGLVDTVAAAGVAAAMESGVGEVGLIAAGESGSLGRVASSVASRSTSAAKGFALSQIPQSVVQTGKSIWKAGVKIHSLDNYIQASPPPPKAFQHDDEIIKPIPHSGHINRVNPAPHKSTYHNISYGVPDVVWQVPRSKHMKVH